jgi:hypothetical protein
MGDMIDMFRALQDDRKSENEERMRLVIAANLDGWTRHSEYHWSRLVKGRKLDWWPSTGRWAYGTVGRRQKMFRGEMDELLAFVKEHEK